MVQGIWGYQNTRQNNEDFAITPYLFGVFRGYILGIGICWGHHSLFGALAFGYERGINQRLKEWRINKSF